jgi:hypothetical protein
MYEHQSQCRVRVRKADAAFRKWPFFTQEKDDHESCSDGKNLWCDRLCAYSVS